MPKWSEMSGHAADFNKSHPEFAANQSAWDAKHKTSYGSGKRIVTAEQADSAILDCLAEYTSEISEMTKKAVDAVTQEVLDEIKRHITFNQRTGKYVRAFAMKTSFEDNRNKRNTWYVKAPYYRLTHILEYGHGTKNGRRVKAYPHIIYGEELAQRRLPELIEKAIEGGK